MRHSRFIIQEMHCIGCDLLIEESVSSLAGIARVWPKHHQGYVDVEYDDRAVSENDIMRRIIAEGFSINAVFGD